MDILKGLFGAVAADQAGVTQLHYRYHSLTLPPRCGGDNRRTNRGAACATSCLQGRELLQWHFAQV